MAANIEISCLVPFLAWVRCGTIAIDNTLHGCESWLGCTAISIRELLTTVFLRCMALTG